jgi:predicted molibdopterin-dependent oxidoreductase YjgC
VSRFLVQVDGRDVDAREGDTVASVLVRDGLVAWRRTRAEGAPRGLFCGIGACHDCLVTVDGVAGVRACLAPADPGCSITTSEAPDA